MSLALFDLDRTLLDVNSGHLWLRAEWRDGRIGWTDAARAVWWLGRYALGDDDLDRALDEAAAMYAGHAAAEMAARVDAWFDRELAHRVRPGARAALARHRDAGDTLVLATTSSQWVARCAARHLGLDHAISTVLEQRDDELTGRIAIPAHGPYKQSQVRAWADAHGHALDHATFYTDSYSDLPLLRAVARPIVVHPDRRLAREAARRKWPVVDWGRAP